jgi:hypothetical protein
MFSLKMKQGAHDVFPSMANNLMTVLSISYSDKMTASPSTGVIGPKKTNAVKVTMAPFSPGERRRSYKLEVT